MGRVRRYKKIKACDPFSKKKGNDPKSLLYDEPPEEYEQRQKRKLSKLKKQFQEVETLDTPIDSSFLPPQESTVSSLNDKLLQQQAKRELQIQNSVYLSSSHNLSKSNGNEPKINLTIQPGESMKKFMRRVDQEKRRILLEEVPKQSASASKRKEKFKMVKLKRKLKKAGKLDSLDEEVVEFGSREDGYIRPSDHQESRADFIRQESIPFGETAEAPPNLKSYALQLTKKQSKKDLAILNSFSPAEVVNEDDLDDNIEENTFKKKRKKKSDWDKFNADDGSNTLMNQDFMMSSAFSSSNSIRHFPNDPLAYLNQQKKQRKVESSLSNQRILEKQRQEIQLKYNELRDRRRSSQTVM